MARLKKVLVCGVFDLLHLGHLWFFTQAKRHGNHLTVLVARDANVLKAKGKKPFFKEKERLQLLSALKIVDKAILGHPTSLYKGVLKARPDVVVLGYDQAKSAGKLLGLRGSRFSEKQIEKKLSENGLKVKVVRLRRGWMPKRFKSSNIKSTLKMK